jgi:hypothetical protein
VSDAQKLTARDAEVLWAIRTFFEVNKYKTALHFDEVLEACPENIVAGMLKPILEHLEVSRFLRRDPHGLFSLTPLGLGVIEKRNSFDRGTFTAFCDLLLVALANHSEQQVTKFDAFDLRSIAELYALEFTPGWIEGASEVFEKRELAKIKRLSESEQDGLISAALTGPGLLEAERLKRVLQDQGVDGPSYVPSKAASVTNAPALSMGADQEENAAQTARKAGRVRSDAWGGAWGRAWGSGVSGSAANPIPIPAADRFVTRTDNVRLFEEAEQELDTLIEAVRAANDLKVTADERLAIISEVEGISSLLKQPAVRARAIYDAVRENGLLKWLAVAAGAGVVGEKATAAVNALLALVGL